MFVSSPLSPRRSQFSEMEKGNVKEAHSSSSQDEADAIVKHPYSAQDVADAFVQQYYSIMQDSPREAHKFYKDESILVHPSADGSMKSATTLKGIDHEITTSKIKNWNPDLSNVHAQESIMDSVIIVVNGSLTDNDDVTRPFTHTFFLAPQEGGGFYVHNDFLRFIEVKVSEKTSSLTGDAASPLISPQANEAAKEYSLETAQALNEVQTNKSASTKDGGNKVADSSEGKKSLPAEPNKKGKSVAFQPAPTMHEDTKRVSYASIVAKEGSVSSAQHVSPNAVARVLSASERLSRLSLTVTKPSAPPVKASMVSSNNALENVYDVKSIRIKDLPPKMSQESLLEAVKRFGPLKQKNIQIKEYSEDRYRYAFVEFDNATSARTAVEARFIHIEDRECEIQYKRYSTQGGYNNMGRSQSGRGGFRNDNFWARDGEGHSSGSWGRNNEHESSGNYFGRARDYNYRRNRYFQDQSRAFT